MWLTRYIAHLGLCVAQFLISVDNTGYGCNSMLSPITQFIGCGRDCLYVPLHGWPIKWLCSMASEFSPLLC
jgi:hypothetical protein